MLLILAKGVVRPDKRDAFIAAAREQIVETRKEAGCIAYDFYESQTEPNTFVFNERWKSKEAIDAHFQTAHIRKFMSVLPTCVAEPPVIELVEVARIGPLA
ncbi:MAG: antibiotic biosynthesis monooxygenase [Hyphomicrobiales bacterium]|nr:antibiotic biosynthesis monooxygenase [Hyphomicrobiales bacterium]